MGILILLPLFVNTFCGEHLFFDVPTLPVPFPAHFSRWERCSKRVSSRMSEIKRCREYVFR